MRTSRRCCAPVPDRRIQRLRLTSKDVQSTEPSPVPASRTRGCASRCSRWPLLRGLALALAGVGAAPEELLRYHQQAAHRLLICCRDLSQDLARRLTGLPLQAWWPPSRGALFRSAASAQRHSPKISVRSSCPRGRMGFRAQPAQVHSCSGSVSGYLHT